MQELSHDVTRKYAPLVLPDSIHCQHNALLESSSTLYWDPPSHVQMTYDVGHGRSPDYGTQSIVSAVYSGSRYRLVGLSQHLTQGLAHHVNFHNDAMLHQDYHLISPVESAVHRDGDMDHQYMYYRSSYSSSVRFHQDAADASLSGYIPHQPAQSGISGDVEMTGTQGLHVPMNELMAHTEKQVAPSYFEDNSQSGTYLEETFGKESVKSLLFQDPSDPVIKSAPYNSNPPVHIVKQKLFIPYDRTKRTLQERSKNPLPSPTFFNCDDGAIGVSLGRARQGHGLAMNSNHSSPLGDRQTLQLKIWVHCLLPACLLKGAQSISIANRFTTPQSLTWTSNLQQNAQRI
ncbi:hypothetical protein HETIRDRAFT_168115 [Heterobasidion irregulare TC 32-1]|uniref:Uncharacterized protein n=1 Tax=Heterobasidion irregulare (strain TC 32-1) TaxID=747525 RepID=W4KII2_HETIT|nr:uncharacterized protein HETIRDRAFT_168115 [Heterobasidion irregulare TC 32-1]ETW85668.1 hypothetical protein HETIRDRAFT_168115 [Heterobasidion irregulare TC 32-1]